MPRGEDARAFRAFNHDSPQVPLGVPGHAGVSTAADDAERVAELTVLFRDLVRDGLVPTINDGLKVVNPKSPAFTKLREVRGYAADDVVKVKTATGKLTANPRVKDSLKELDELEGRLK